MTREGIGPCAQAIADAGYRVSFGEHTFSMTDGYAASAEERAADFNAAVADPDVSMILFPGGEISNEIIPLIDYGAIAAHPKIISSYSDGTSVLNPVTYMTGLVTFYGGSTRLFEPVTEYNMQGFLRRLVQGSTEYTPASDWRVIRPGSGSGVLCGGYTVNFDSLIGLPQFGFPDRDYILILEDHERFSSPKVESKWLNDLLQKGAFDRAKAVIFGHYSSDPEKLEKLFPVLRRISDRIKIPFVYTDDFGHGANMALFPLGTAASLEAGVDSVKFSFLEPAVEI